MTTNLSSIAPGPNDRGFIVGQTGSGKTVLAHALLAYRPNVAVLDPKRRINWPGYTVYHTLKSTIKGAKRNRRVVFRPDHKAILEWQDDDSEINAFFEWVYLRGKTTVYVDEAYLVTNGNVIPPFYHACLTQGRELGIETWTATQRPIDIPQVLMSESEHDYVFALRMPQDRRKVESVCAVQASSIERLEKFQFLYAPQDGKVRGPYTLDLSNRSL